MTRKGPGFVADRLSRLLCSSWYQQKRAAIEAQVRQKYRDELFGVTGYWRRFQLERKIRDEVKKELTGPGSPYCLWFCR